MMSLKLGHKYQWNRLREVAFRSHNGLRREGIGRSPQNPDTASLSRMASISPTLAVVCHRSAMVQRKKNGPGEVRRESEKTIIQRRAGTFRCRRPQWAMSFSLCHPDGPETYRPVLGAGSMGNAIHPLPRTGRWQESSQRRAAPFVFLRGQKAVSCTGAKD